MTHIYRTDYYPPYSHQKELGSDQDLLIPVPSAKHIFDMTVILRNDHHDRWLPTFFVGEARLVEMV